MTLNDSPLWLPGTYTKPLSATNPNFSTGDKIIRLSELAWKSSERPEGVALWDFQRWLIRHVTERFPQDWPDERLRGRMRYRQVVISMARQNSKSVIGGIFGLYGLTLHSKGPLVMSIAHNTKNAGIIFDRIKYVVDHNPSIRKRFKRSTETRGLATHEGGTYSVYAGTGDALQSYPVSMAIADELHLLKEEAWGALLIGGTNRQDSMLIGLSTAGDEKSVLLKKLYEQGELAAAGDPDYLRFGFFRWEAPPDATIDNDAHIIAANPAVAEGHRHIDDIRAEMRGQPQQEIERYVLNRFVSSSSNWLPMNLWQDSAGQGIPAGLVPTVYGIDQTKSGTFGSIVGAVRHEGIIYTELIASIKNPSQEQLLDICIRLAAHGPATFVVDGYVLRRFGKELKAKGFEVEILTLGELGDACAGTYKQISLKQVIHNDDPLVNLQMPRAVRKNDSEGGWRITRGDTEVDSVLATAFGIYGAANTEPSSFELHY